MDEESKGEEEQGSDSQQDEPRKKLLEKPKARGDGKLSEDFPAMLGDLEQLYQTFREQKLSIVHDMEDEDDKKNKEDEAAEVKDYEFEYYLMLQSMNLLVTYLRKLLISETVYRMGKFQMLDSSVERSD